MIEFKFTGNSLEEIQGELFATANVIAQGRQLQQLAAQAANKKGAEAEQKLAAEVKAEDPPATKPAKKAKTVVEPVAETKPAEPEADSAEDAVENEETAQPVPSTIDELRALAMKAMDKIGSDKAKAILQQYAPKLADIPKDKIAACGKDFLKAMDAA
jgi:hypothetical protein